MEYRADVGGGLTEHEVVDIFVAEATAGLTIAPNPDEVAATRWVDLYDLAPRLRRWPGPFTPWLRIYLAEHTEQIFGALRQAALERFLSEIAGQSKMAAVLARGLFMHQMAKPGNLHDLGLSASARRRRG